MTDKDKNLMIGYIYKVTFPDKKSYIGQTTTDVIKRFKKHVECAKRNKRFGCKAINHAINMYDLSEIELSTLYTGPINQLNEREIHFIKEYNSLFPNGYNLTTGGNNIIMFYDDKPFNYNDYIDNIDKYQDKVIMLATRIHNNYNLPLGVYEYHDESKNQHGFRYYDISGNGYKDHLQHDFLHSKHTMEEKYNEVMKCYNMLTGGEEYIRRNPYKRDPNDELEYPEGVVKIGDHGFALNVPGENGRRTFAHKNNTREENLANAIEALRLHKQGEKLVLNNAQKGHADEIEHIQYITRLGENGFTVQKTGYANKKFNNSKLSRKANHDKARAYLNLIENGTIPKSNSAVKIDIETGREIPIGITCSIRGGGGFIVNKTTNFPEKLFANRNLTREQNLDNAIEHLNTRGIHFIMPNNN